MESQAQWPAAEELEQHAHFVRSLARHLVGDEAGADDLAQEALLRYVESPPRSVFDPRAWFARVLRNLAHNQRRSGTNRALREQRAAKHEAQPAPDEQLLHAALLRSVVDAVLALDEPYRSTIVARYYRGFEPSRIARETNTPLATVKSRLARAHGQLRERLDRGHGSRDAWGVALASWVGGPTTTAATLASTPLWLAAAAVVLGAIGIAVWRGTGARELELAHSEGLAAPGRVGPTALVDQQAPAQLVEGTRQPIQAGVEPGMLVIAGRLTNTAYAPLSLAAGPASGVELQLRFDSVPPQAEQQFAKLAATTDAQGRFRVELPRPTPADCRLEITLRADADWRPVRAEFALGAHESALEGIELTRIAHGFVEGLVVDRSGTPVPRFALRVAKSSLLRLPALDLQSDEQGAIRCARPGVSEVELLQSGWTLLGIERAQPLPEGGSSGLRVIVARGAGLRVRLQDSAGRPVSGVAVNVELAAAECKPAYQSRMEESPSVGATTDDAGVAELEGLWAEHKLCLTLSDANNHARSSGLRGNELLFGAAELDGDGIVLRAGEVRELLVRWTGLLRIVGDVRRGEALPAAEVEVSVFDLGAAGGEDRCLAKARSDAHGAFVLELRARELLGPLLLLAGEPKPGKPSALAGLGYAGESSPLNASRAELELDLAQAREGQLEAHLMLEPLATIRGRVLESDGSSLKQPSNSLDLRCVRSGESTPRLRPRQAQPKLRWDEDGSFEFSGLRAGNHDLSVFKVQWPTFYSWKCSAQHLRDVPAGSHDVVLVLAPRELTRIKVRIIGAAPQSVIGLRGKLLEAATDESFDAAPRTLAVQDVSGWPAQATQRFTGISGGRDRFGSWSFGFDEFAAALEFELPPVDPGVYVFGLHAFGDDARTQWFPQASRPMRFEAGEYTIEFHPVATTRLEGALVGPAREQRFGIQLADAAGRIVPLSRPSGSERPQLVLELDAAGRFSIEHAPVGRFALRAGTLAELAQGRFRIELPIEITADGAGPIELRL